jgi:hypothetical protein
MQAHRHCAALDGVARAEGGTDREVIGWGRCSGGKADAAIQHNFACFGMTHGHVAGQAGRVLGHRAAFDQQGIAVVDRLAEADGGVATAQPVLAPSHDGQARGVAVDKDPRQQRRAKAHGAGGRILVAGSGIAGPGV